MYFHQKKLLTNSQKISKSKNYNFTNYRKRLNSSQSLFHSWTTLMYEVHV